MMNCRSVAIAAFPMLLLLPGCLEGRGPAGEAGNAAMRGTSSLATLLTAGRLYLAADCPNDAFVAFKRAVQLDGKSYEAQLGLARACAELGEATLGMEAAEAAAALKPKEADPLLAAGRICAGSWKLDHAERYYARAVKLAPTNAEAWRELGRVRLRRAAITGSSVSEAVTALVRARDLDGKNAEARALLAEAYVRASRPDAAIAEYTRAVALDPSNADYPRNLAWLLIMRGRDLDRARELALKSDQLQRGDGDALVAAAVALLRQGQIEEAIEEFQEVIRKSASNPDAYFFLAQATAQRGRPGDYETAVSALQYMKGMGLTPTHASQRELEQLLDRIRTGLQRLQTGT